MLGSGLSTGPGLLGVVGLDGGDVRTSMENAFVSRPGLKGPSGESVGERGSESENLLIRSLMLLDRCRFELRVKPTGLLGPDFRVASTSSLVGLAGGLEVEESGGCWKRRTQ